MRQYAWGRNHVFDRAPGAGHAPDVDATPADGQRVTRGTTTLRRIAHMGRAMRLGTIVVVSTACFHIGPSTGSAPAEDWQGTLATAQGDVAAGHFEAADSMLAAYAARFPGSPEALETAYWRALYKMDPSNHSASIPTAMASLDGYLADRRPRQHVSEATTLRRVAGQIDGLNKLAASAMAQANVASANASSAKAVAAADAAKAAEAGGNVSQDAEIKHLKDELAKANAELERIRKRLASPPPPR